MSALGEKTLIAHLPDVASMKVLVADGMNLECVPTEALRPVVGFAIDYFHANGMDKAPSVAVLRTEYGDVLDDYEINVEEEPDETIEWAIADLKASWVYSAIATFNKEFASAMAEVPTHGRIDVVHEHAAKLVEVSQGLDPKARKVDVRVGLTRTLNLYEARKAIDGLEGMGIGLDGWDQMTHGVRPGELMVHGAYAKVGKSLFMGNAALSEWRRGRAVALFTLELSVDTMLDRVACLATHVDAAAWQEGRSTPEDEERVRAFREEMAASDVPLWVLRPEVGRRNFSMMVREATVRGADSLMIDQLTFVELPEERRQKHERIGIALHHLVGELDTAGLPCLLNHQVNREGFTRAQKQGYLDILCLADSSEVERTADFVAATHQTEEQRVVGQARFQTLASRRTAHKDWEAQWEPRFGLFRTMREVPRA